MTADMNESMTPNINEFAVVIAARQNNPTILNQDFLKVNKIIPKDWELKQPSMCIEPISSLVFKNSISIVSQFDKIVFSQQIKNSSKDEVKVPEIAVRYLNALPYVNYIAVGINPRSIVSFEGRNLNPYKYVVDKFISHGSWKNIGSEQIEATISFRFHISNAQINVNLSASSKKEKNRVDNLLIFAGNFHRSVKADSIEEKKKTIEQIILNWHNDWDVFLDQIVYSFIR